MAYALDLPLIVMMETGLREEGLLEQNYDWYIDRLSISGDALANRPSPPDRRLVPPCAGWSAAA